MDPIIIAILGSSAVGSVLTVLVQWLLNREKNEVEIQQAEHNFYRDSFKDHLGTMEELFDKVVHMEATNTTLQSENLKHSQTIEEQAREIQVLKAEIRRLQGLLKQS